MKKLFCAVVVMLSCVWAFGISLGPNDISSEALQKLLVKKYSITRSDDNLVLTDAGLKVIISIEAKQKLIRIFSLYDSQGKSRNELLKMANDFNNEKIIVRVYVDDDNDVWCDWYLNYVDGISEDNLFDSIDWFLKINKAWNEKMN